jgi:hypothetical protein
MLPVPDVLSQLACQGCHATVPPSWLSFPSCPVLALIFWHSCLLFPSCLYCPNCPFRLSCPVPPVRPSTLVPSSPVPAVLSLAAISWPSYRNVISVLSTLICPGLTCKADLSRQTDFHGQVPLLAFTVLYMFTYTFMYMYMFSLHCACSCSCSLISAVI